MMQATLETPSYVKRLGITWLGFFSLIGGVMTIIGISDYLGRGQYRRRIKELEQRRQFLRERMFEAYVS